MSDSFFITGTDTGVGKTVVTAALARGLRRLGRDVGVMKPVATGTTSDHGRLRSGDALFLMEAISSSDPYEMVNPICLEPPLAPLAASILSGEDIDLNLVWDALERMRRRHEAVLVEGIGGLLVPITRDVCVVDMAVRIGMPLLVVARPGLGTLNHTALTVRCAREAGLEVEGIIFNHADAAPGGPAEKTNLEIIESLTGVPVAASIPYIRDLDPRAVPDDLFNDLLSRRGD